MTDKVYFIRSGDLIKIGFTTRSAVSRLKAMETGSSINLVLLGAISGGLEREKELHKRFQSLREKGEWFRPNSEMLDYIDAILSEEGVDPRSSNNSAISDHVERSRKWLADVLRFKSKVSGKTILEAREEFADEIGVTRGTLRNLQLGRMITIDAALYEALYKQKLDALREEIKELQSTLNHVRAGIGNERADKAENSLAAARKIMDEVK